MNLSQLAEQLKNGSITLAEWQSAMKDYLREQYRIALELAKGGAGNITQSDWGYMGSLLRKQYQYLDNFAQDIVNDPAKWLWGNNLINRMNLYSDAAYSALADLQARAMTEAGFTEEANVLGAADHCDQCLEETAKSWQPIGTLVPVGERICIVKCKCSMKYRKQLADGSYIYG